jgi:hypothetical protein
MEPRHLYNLEKYLQRTLLKVDKKSDKELVKNINRTLETIDKMNDDAMIEAVSRLNGIL